MFRARDPRARAEQLEAAFLDAERDPAFRSELDSLLTTYAGRPTPLTLCRNLGGNARIYLKREDLLHGGAHKTNQVLGQALLAKRMGKKRLIAETGAGQHGVATAIAGALFGFKTRIYMGAEDVQRQELNVFRMQLMGAEVIAVEGGGRTLKDAINEALRDWSASFEDTHYLLGTAAGPHPFPTMVREFQRVIGREARAQLLEAEGRLPDGVLACVGGGSNAIGIFADFLRDERVRLIGVEAAGRGLSGEEHSATIQRGAHGIFTARKPWCWRTRMGRSAIPGRCPPASIIRPSAPSMRISMISGGPTMSVARTEDALDAFVKLARCEGILAAFESCHALAEALKMAERAEPGALLIVSLSGRGDKDVAQAKAMLGDKT